MSHYTIYHNPRCTKSRESLALLKEAGIEPEVVFYLQDTPSTEELAHICELLGKRPTEIMRVNESIFKMLWGNAEEMSDDKALELMIQNPVLIERPIIVKDDKAAVIGRPAERVKELL